MRRCPLCDTTYGDEVSTCPLDGARLTGAEHEGSLVGQVVKGRYRVLRKLGEGGMGAVYLAEQLSISRKVALKLLHREFARDREFVQRFHQEAKLAASLNDPRITTVFDFDQGDDGSLFIVMEYLEGTSLNDLIRREGPLDVARAVRLGVQIAEGLGAAHAAGVIHRDIKPQNIMVLAPGDAVKLMDFGIARLGDTGEAHLTRRGALMGTPSYMAPEQIEGRPVSARTDIYAFGVVLYEMLTGTTPFSAPTSTAVLAKQLRDAPRPVRGVRPEVSPLLEQVVMQALEKEPEWRHESMADVVRRLRAAGGLPAQPPPPPVPAVRPMAASPAAAPEPQGATPTMVSAATMVSPSSRGSGIDLAPQTVIARPSPEPASPAPPRGRWWKWAAAGGGIVLVTTGTVAVALYAVRGVAPSSTRQPAVTQDIPKRPPIQPPATTPTPPRLVMSSPRREGLQASRPTQPPSGGLTEPKLTKVPPPQQPADDGEPSPAQPAVRDPIAIRAAVENKLRAAGFLRKSGSDDAGVTVETVGSDGVVRLVGVVRSKDERESVIRLARSVHGVTAVMPRLNVPWSSD
jgi:serine/threonine protein kinase